MKTLISMLFLFSLSGVMARSFQVDCVSCKEKFTSMANSMTDVTLNHAYEHAGPSHLKVAVTEAPKTKTPYISGCSGRGVACYQRTMCTKFKLFKDRYDIEEMLDEIPSMPAFNHVDEYLFMIECSPIHYNQNIGIKAPMIHLIVDSPDKFSDALETIFENYDLNGDRDKFTQILNLQSNRGETFLDYLYYVQNKDATSMTVHRRTSMKKIFDYACSKGAIFKKFESEVSCPKSINIDR